MINRQNLQRKILKAAQDKEFITYKWASLRLTVDFSKETTEARRQHVDILIFQNSGEIGIFRKTKAANSASRPTLQEKVKLILQIKIKRTLDSDSNTYKK